MTIELLFVDGCQGHEQVLAQVQELPQRPGWELVLRRIDTPDQAVRERFLGSPTVRVDGRDVDPGAAGRTDWGLTCRTFGSGSGRSAVPPRRWIEAALTRA